VATIHPVVFAYLYPLISMLLFSRYLGVRKNWHRMKTEWCSNRSAILICGVLSIFGYFLILVAFTVDRVSYIVGLRQLSIVFAVLLGGFALNEEHRAIRLTFALVVFAGTFLIATG
jgi:drug/metabolite transporter (DMT)-like permease